MSLLFFILTLFSFANYRLKVLSDSLRKRTQQNITLSGEFEVEVIKQLASATKMKQTVTGISQTYSDQILSEHLAKFFYYKRKTNMAHVIAASLSEAFATYPTLSERHRQT